LERFWAPAAVSLFLDVASGFLFGFLAGFFVSAIGFSTVEGILFKAFIPP
jgi:uncharacterized membrane protein YdjX (TVP38/TMEM64 family)